MVDRNHLGCSNYKMIDFSVLGEFRRRVSKTATLEFRTADTELFKTLVLWESILSDKGVQVVWTFLKKEILMAQKHVLYDTVEDLLG